MHRSPWAALVVVSLLAIPGPAPAYLPEVAEGASGWIGHAGHSWTMGQVGMTLDAEGTPHIVYGQFIDGETWALWYKTWDREARRWVPDQPLLDPNLCDAYPDIAIDAAGTLHVVYCDGVNGGDAFGVGHFSKAPGQPWQQRMVEAGVRGWRGGHGIAIDPDTGRPAVVYQDAASGRIWYEVQEENGLWWGMREPVILCDPQQLLAGCCKGLSKPSLAFDDAGMAYLACSPTDVNEPPMIFLARRLGPAGWAYEAAPGGPLGGPSVHPWQDGGDGKVALSWYDAGNLSVWFAERSYDDPGAWEMPQVVAQGVLAADWTKVATDLKVVDLHTRAVLFNDSPVGGAPSVYLGAFAGPDWEAGKVDGYCEELSRWIDLELELDSGDLRAAYLANEANPRQGAAELDRQVKYMAWDEPWPYEQPPAPDPWLHGAMGATSDRFEEGPFEPHGDRWVCYYGFDGAKWDLLVDAWEGVGMKWLDELLPVDEDIGQPPSDQGRACALAFYQPDELSTRLGVVYVKWIDDDPLLPNDYYLLYNWSADGGISWQLDPILVGPAGPHTALTYIPEEGGGPPDHLGRAAIAYQGGDGQPHYAEVFWDNGGAPPGWAVADVAVRPGVSGGSFVSLDLDPNRTSPRMAFVGTAPPPEEGVLWLVWPDPDDSLDWPMDDDHQAKWAVNPGHTALVVAPDQADERIYLAYHDLNGYQVHLWNCDGLPDNPDPPPNCAHEVLDDGLTFDNRCVDGQGWPIQCDVGRYLFGSLDGYNQPSFTYMNYTLGAVDEPELGVVVNRRNVVSMDQELKGGWALCDVAPGGAGAALSLDRYGNPMVSSTDFDDWDVVRSFWYP